MMGGYPRQGQTLDEVRNLLIGELEKIKKGEFDDWLVEAAVNNMELKRLKEMEKNWPRAMAMVDAFMWEMEWKKYVERWIRMKEIDKAKLQDFVRKHFSENYVAIYKRQGQDTTIKKVEKPHITPLPLDRSKESEFAKKFKEWKTEPIQPVFVDFQKAIHFDKFQSLDLLKVDNTTNALADMYFVYDLNKKNMPEAPLLAKYFPLLGTSKYSSNDIKKEFFKLGVSLDIYPSSEKLIFHLGGLEKNIDKALPLYYHLLTDIQPDSTAYQNMVQDILKERENRKQNKGVILFQAMANYAKYGKENPFTDIYSSEELQTLNPAQLAEKIQSLTGLEHRIYYYGQNDLQTIKTTLAEKYTIPEVISPVPQEKEYTELEMNEEKVLFTDYDMVQTEILLLSKGQKFNKDLLSYGSLFNEYFGSGLSSIVFQEIRETKALAYSAFCRFSFPKKTHQSHYVTAYVGTQADKLENAVDALLALMNKMPKAEKQFEAAKEAALKNIAADRKTKTELFWFWEKHRDWGLTSDYRKDVYRQIEKMTINDMENFFNQNIAGKKYTYCVIGNENMVDFNALQKLGKINKLSLEEVFGY
ncbi:MAG: insulinase family protein [Bacteroidetes bacterium]|nr:MAG: insulinase family protein [Bacteroidota bacterium]